jgi:hypothetical protein
MTPVQQPASASKIAVRLQHLWKTYPGHAHPVEEGRKVSLNLRPDGHSAWASDWSHREE